MTDINDAMGAMGHGGSDWSQGSLFDAPGAGGGSRIRGNGMGGTARVLGSALQSSAKFMSTMAKDSGTFLKNVTAASRALKGLSGGGSVGNSGLGLGGFSTPPGTPMSAKASASVYSQMLTPGSALRKAALAGTAIKGIAGAFQVASAPLVATAMALPGAQATRGTARSTFNTGVSTGMGAAAVQRGIVAGVSGRFASQDDDYAVTNTLASRGFNFTKGTGQAMLQQTAGFAMLTGMSGNDVASSTNNQGLSGSFANGMRMLGVDIHTKDGGYLPVQQVADKLWSKFNLGRLTADQIAQEFTIPSRNGARLLALYVPDQGYQQMLIAYWQNRANQGGKATNMADLGALANSAKGGLALESSANKVAGSRTNMQEGQRGALTTGITDAQSVISAANNTIAGSQSTAMKTLVSLSAGADAMATDPTGEGIIAGATTAISGMTKMVGAAAQALQILTTASLGAAAANAAGGAGAAGAVGKVATLAKLAKGATIAGLAATAVNIGANYIPKSVPVVGHGKTGNKWLKVAADAGAGAVTGGAIATAIPVPILSTAVGAVVGGTIAGGAGIYSNFFSGNDKGDQTNSGGASGSGATSGASGGSSTTTAKNATSGVATNAALVRYALSFVGVKYVWGGTSPTKGWDCSGFTGYVFRKFGISLPRTSQAQARVGKAATMATAMPGDLLFFHYPTGHAGVNHVAIYIGGGRQVGAQNHKTGTVTGSVDRAHLVGVRRVIGGTLAKAVGAGVGASTNSVAPSVAGGAGGYMSSSGVSFTVSSSGISVGSASTLASQINSGSGFKEGSWGGASAANSGGSGTDTATSGTNVTSGADPTQRGNATPGHLSPHKVPDAQLISILRSAGFSGAGLATAWGVSGAESGHNSNAHNPVPPDNSYGLFQINMLGGMGPARRAQYHLKSNEDLYDPATNARAAYDISRHGTNWRPWTTYTHGSYKQFMGGAPSYSKGSWRISGDQVANVHDGEMVVPKGVAQAVRDSVALSAAGQSPGRSAVGNVTINVTLADATGADAVRFGRNLKSVLLGEASVDSLKRG